MMLKRILSFALSFILLCTCFGVTAVALEEAPEQIMLSGSFNGFEGTAMEQVAENAYSLVLELNEGNYLFNVNKGEATLGNPGTIIDTTENVSDAGFTFVEGVRANCTLVATGGSYEFSFNTDTNKLKVVKDNESIADIEGDALVLNFGENNVTAQAGDVVTYNVYLNAHKSFEDIQAVLSFDESKLNLISTTAETASAKLGEATLNTDIGGLVAVNSNDINGFDFTEEALLLTLSFEVVAGGETSFQFTLQEMTATDGDVYYAFSSEISEGVKLREEVIVTAPQKPVEFMGSTVTLTGKIAVNFYMALSEEVVDDANTKMRFTLPNGTKKSVSLKSAEEKDGVYVFTCELAAKEMSAKIKAQLSSSNYTSEVFEYSVKEYAQSILEGSSEEYENAKPLVKAMLNYGAAAQVYFGYRIGNLANSFLSDAEKVIPEADFSEYAFAVEGSEEGVSYYGSRLSLESGTVLKHYFYIEGAENLPEVTVNGEKALLTKEGGYYEVKISEIFAQNLDDKILITVGGITLDYNAFSYGLLVMQGEDAPLKNVMNALYAYNAEASVY